MTPSLDPPDLASPEALHPRRLVRLQGAHNFRDLGGYPTADGRRVRWGRVYRSDHLHTLTDDDLRTVAGLGLRVVYDFRIDREVHERPSRLPDPSPDVVRLATSDLGNGAETMLEMITDALAGRGPFPPPDFWATSYDGMFEDARPMFVALFEGLADASRLPAMYHCTGGKDRTGMASMLLLDMLAVAPDIALDDFELTNVHRLPARAAALRPQLEAAGVDPVGALAIIGVVRAAMAHIQRRLAAEYGSAGAYLRAGGLAADVPERLRSLLLTP